MSGDRVTQSDDHDGRNGKSTNSVQSVWMAHWTRTAYNNLEEINHPLSTLEHKENDQDGQPPRSVVQLETISKFSKSVKRLREFETQTFEVINGSVRTSSRTITKETTGPRQSRPASKVCHIQCEGSFQDPQNRVKSQGGSMIASTSHLYQDPNPHVTKQGEKMPKAIINREFLAAKENVSKLRMLECECYKYHDLECDEKLKNCPEVGRSFTPNLRQNITMLLDIPSTSMTTKHLPELNEENFQRIPESSTFLLAESKELHPFSFVQQKLPHHLHDIERTTKRNNVDSVMGLTGYCPSISQKTHCLLITEKTGASLCEGNKVINNSRVWNEFNGKVTDHYEPSKSFGHYNGGIKLQLLECSTSSERKEHIEDSKSSKIVVKNESSAETDTMDIDLFQKKNQLCGTSFSTVKKMREIDQNSAPRLPLEVSKKEGGFKLLNVDINLELPAPTENVEPTSSRTESLDFESVLAHAEQPHTSKTHICTEGLRGQDPSTRWVKRLKVGASGLAFGSKTCSFTRESSHEKEPKFLEKVVKASSSEQTSGKLNDIELMAHYNSHGLALNSSPSSLSIIKNNLELLSSHSWIQRLLHDKATTAEKRSKPVVICEPESSKLELEDFQRKQLPSLGAMALMGKMMNGFQRCAFKRRGPIVVWNPRSF